jgi:hypothetical protein
MDGWRGELEKVESEAACLDMRMHSAAAQSGRFIQLGVMCAGLSRLDAQFHELHCTALHGMA